MPGAIMDCIMAVLRQLALLPRRLVQCTPSSRAISSACVARAATISAAQSRHSLQPGAGRPRMYVFASALLLPLFCDAEVETLYQTFLANETDTSFWTMAMIGFFGSVAYLESDLVNPAAYARAERIWIRVAQTAFIAAAALMWLLRHRCRIPARVQLWYRTVCYIAMTAFIHVRSVLEPSFVSYVRSVGIWSIAMKAALATGDCGLWRALLFNTVDSALDIGLQALVRSAVDADPVRWDIIVWFWFSLYAFFADLSHRIHFARACELYAMRVMSSRSSSLHRYIVDNAVDMVMVHRVGDGRLMYVSAACTPLIGFSPDELRGRSLHDFVHPDDAHALTALLSVRGGDGGAHGDVHAGKTDLVNAPRADSDTDAATGASWWQSALARLPPLTAVAAHGEQSSLVTPLLAAHAKFGLEDLNDLDRASDATTTVFTDDVHLRSDRDDARLQWLSSTGDVTPRGLRRTQGTPALRPQSRTTLSPTAVIAPIEENDRHAVVDADPPTALDRRQQLQPRSASPRGMTYVDPRPPRSTLSGRLSAMPMLPRVSGSSATGNPHGTSVTPPLGDGPMRVSLELTTTTGTDAAVSPSNVTLTRFDGTWRQPLRLRPSDSSRTIGAQDHHDAAPAALPGVLSEQGVMQEVATMTAGKLHRYEPTHALDAGSSDDLSRKYELAAQGLSVGDASTPTATFSQPRLPAHLQASMRSPPPVFVTVDTAITAQSEAAESAPPAPAFVTLRLRHKAGHTVRLTASHNITAEGIICVYRAAADVGATGAQGNVPSTARSVSPTPLPFTPYAGGEDAWDILSVQFAETISVLRKRFSDGQTSSVGRGPLAAEHAMRRLNQLRVDLLRATEIRTASRSRLATGVE